MAEGCAISEVDMDDGITFGTDVHHGPFKPVCLHLCRMPKYKLGFAKRLYVDDYTSAGLCGSSFARGKREFLDADEPKRD
jgi:hypothetical protein